MEIREDPKYIALIDQGVCSLEIRKPGPFDGGVYTCKAVNPLGEASVDCRLDVKGESGLEKEEQEPLPAFSRSHFPRAVVCPCFGLILVVRKSKDSGQPWGAASLGSLGLWS